MYLFKIFIVCISDRAGCRFGVARSSLCQIRALKVNFFNPLFTSLPFPYNFLTSFYSFSFFDGAGSRNL